MTDIPAEMMRYCCRCRQPLEARAIVRRATFHPECGKADRKARRDHRASRACRLCGRPARKSKQAPEATTQSVSVTQPDLELGHVD